MFTVRDGVAFTPIPKGSFLNGITRQRIIALLREAGTEVQEVTLSYEDFHAADEVFLTGNLAKVTSVTAFRGSYHFRQNWTFDATTQNSAQVRENIHAVLLELDAQVKAGMLSGKYCEGVIPEGSRRSLNDKLGGRYTDASEPVGHSLWLPDATIFYQ